MTTGLVRADSGIVTNYQPKDTPEKPCEAKELPEELPRVHPLIRDVKDQVDEYVLSNWEFPSNAAKQGFITRNISSTGAYYFPYALDERIFVISRLLALLHLVAGMDMDLCKMARRGS